MRRPVRKRWVVLDNKTRERRRTAERFVGDTLSAVRLSIREREDAVLEDAARAEHFIPVDSEWREGAWQAFAGCRQVLDDPRTCGEHLARLPGAAGEMRRLTRRLDDTLTRDQVGHARRAERDRERRMERGGDGVSH